MSALGSLHKTSTTSSESTKTPPPRDISDPVALAVFRANPLMGLTEKAAGGAGLTSTAALPITPVLEGASGGAGSVVYEAARERLCLVTAPKFVDSPMAELWDELNDKTDSSLSRVECYSLKDLAHRYSSIRCPIATAISVAGCPLHANRVGVEKTSRSLVASQAPLPSHFSLFWQALYELNAPIVLDLTSAREHRDNPTYTYYPTKTEEPCIWSNLLPKAGVFGSVLVTLTKVDEKLMSYTYAVVPLDAAGHPVGGPKEVTRYHFQAWEDAKGLKPSILDGILSQVEALPDSPARSLWVHCSAGVGRTGTLLTALILKELISQKKVTLENLETHLIKLIISLRTERGPHFVSNQEQLETLINYAQWLIESLKGT